MQGAGGGADGAGVGAAAGCIMGAATVVAAFCYFQFAWSLLKLPWMFSFAAALGLPHAYKPHPDGRSGGRCPLMLSPIMRTKAWQRSPPAWIGYHTIFASAMELIFALTVTEVVGVRTAVPALATCFAMQLPFFGQFYCNLGSLPPLAAAVVNVGACTLTVGLFLYIYPDRSATDISSAFWALLAIWQLPPLIDVAVCIKSGKLPWSPASEQDFDAQGWPPEKGPASSEGADPLVHAGRAQDSGSAHNST